MWSNRWHSGKRKSPNVSASPMCSNAHSSSPLPLQQQQQQQQLRMCLKCTLQSWWGSWVDKCLPPKLDGLWSISRAHLKCLAWWCLHLTSGQGRLEIHPWAHWSTGLACLRNSRFNERTYLKQGRWHLKNDTRAWPQVFTQGSSMCTHTQTHNTNTHTHTHTCANKQINKYTLWPALKCCGVQTIQVLLAMLRSQNNLSPSPYWI